MGMKVLLGAFLGCVWLGLVGTSEGPNADNVWRVLQADCMFADTTGTCTLMDFDKVVGHEVEEILGFSGRDYKEELCGAEVLHEYGQDPALCEGPFVGYRALVPYQAYIDARIKTLTVTLAQHLNVGDLDKAIVYAQVIVKALALKQHIAEGLAQQRHEDMPVQTSMFEG